MVLMFSMIVGLAVCGSNEQYIMGTYISDNEETMLVCDNEIIFIVQGDDVGQAVIR